MYIEYIKEGKNQMGSIIPVGTRCHKLNEAAKELIKAGIVKPVEDPENYDAYPLETEKTSVESSTDENETDIKPNTPKRRKRKTMPKRR